MKKKEPRDVESERLYKMCLTGDQKGWKEVNRYVYGIMCWKKWNLSFSEREDLTQDTLLYFISESGLKKVQKPKAFKTLLLMKAKCKIIDFYRQTQVRITDSISSPFNENDDYSLENVLQAKTEDPDESIFRKQILSLCMEIFSSLKKKECAKILPIYFAYKANGQGSPQLAKEMKKPVGTIAAKINRCIVLLNKHAKYNELKELYYQRG
ncbi:hypothetical protein KKB18_04490 [bacterium]|nr:hypothetical protein [bacterium]